MGDPKGPYANNNNNNNDVVIKQNSNPLRFSIRLMSEEMIILVVSGRSFGFRVVLDRISVHLKPMSVKPSDIT